MNEHLSNAYFGWLNSFTLDGQVRAVVIKRALCRHLNWDRRRELTCPACGLDVRDIEMFNRAGSRELDWDTYAARLRERLVNNDHSS